MQYRREGRLTFLQVVLWVAFLVYALALWTYTLLPLPDPDDMRCVGTQLTPFQFVADIRSYPIGSLGSIAHNPAVMQVALNVALFVPLGFFLRFFWRRGVVVTTVVGLLISLLIECTQLTGVWGVYDCAYRFFDVDDLIVNTTGALVGGLVAALVLPGRTDPDDVAAATPRPVTFGRRLVGMICDGLAVWLTGTIAAVAFRAVWLYGLDNPSGSVDRYTNLVAVAVPFVLVGLGTLATGRTIGDSAVLLRWRGGVRPTALRNLLRYLGGIGGWQLISYVLPGWDGLFVVALLVCLIATSSRGGLPGIVSGARPIDSRSVDAPR
jgi:glycopeptide antibiotics resistance protein